MNAKKIFVILLLGIIAYCAFIFISFNPKDDPFLQRYGKSMLDKNDEILSIFLNQNEQYHIKNAAPISQKLKIATIIFEDKNFYSHIGFDLKAIIRSLYLNLKYHKRSGASTITMQSIKLLTRDERSYFNKFRELILALKLEQLYSKDEILEMYLNNAPYGGNIVGVGAASLLYFNKSTEFLSWAQAALLAVLPNAPGLMHTQKNQHLLLEKRNRLLKRLNERGYIDEAGLNLALSEKLPNITKPKNLASHLAYRFDSKIIRSTIDKNIQLKLESRAKSYHKRNSKLGIQNLSAMIINTKTREVLGYAGSQDFFDIAGYGQIDGNIAKRSPGSLLKPLLYALSIDDGLIAPQSLLVDVPSHFSNFKPQNAQKKYHGLIEAQNALIKSLNVPFVWLLQDYGSEKFFYDLKNILQFSDENYARYGLSLILGTKEFSPEDIAKIYLGLGNYGEFGDLIYLKDSIKSAPKRIISSGSSYLALESMRNLERVGAYNRFKNQFIFSWKTGTSYGRKDAWAAGTSPNWTIVVWCGNFSGEGNENIFGLEIAGRLLFEILGDLENNMQGFKKPDDFREIYIDSPTGYRFSDDFIDINKRKIIIPKNAKSLRHSPFLQNVFVDSNGMIVDSRSPNFINAKPTTRLVFPPILAAYYKSQRMLNIKSSIKILYPQNGLKIIRTRDFERQNELIARVANNNEVLFWYIDGEFLGAGSENSRALNIKAGWHNLSIINMDGAKHSVRFEIVK